MSDYVTLVNGTTSAVATGSWFQPNQYSDGFNIINTAGTLGDTYLEVSPDQTVTVSVALPQGVTHFGGTYPYVRAVKAANAPAGAVYLTQNKR